MRKFFIGGFHMMNRTTKMSLATTAKIGALSALAVGLMFLEFPIFSAYSWLKMDFADVPALIGGFAMGPIAGVLIEFIKVFFSFLLKNSGTGGVGELANFLLGVSLVLPAVLIYQRNKRRKNALIGLSVGSVAMTALAPVLNYYILIPLFIGFLGSGFDVGFYLIAGAVPLTAIKAVAQSVVVILLYKRLSGILHKQPH